MKATGKLNVTKELHLSTSELRKTYDDTLVALSIALELRDGQPRGHTLRVTEMTLDLARALEVSPSKLAHIRRGALLHDAGNLRVPEEILRKESELTVEEWITIHMHPFFAYELMSTIPFLTSAMDIPYCHHEKWDGSGYPRGLKGKDIPLAARIFAVADVWDALTTDRPQRKAWSREGARKYIREQSGKHFDPKVVEAFLSHGARLARSRVRRGCAGRRGLSDRGAQAAPSPDPSPRTGEGKKKSGKGICDGSAPSHIPFPVSG